MRSGRASERAGEVAKQSPSSMSHIFWEEDAMDG